MSIPSEVNVAIWRSIVGSSVKIPSVNSYVYYFPQGHLENSSMEINNYNGVRTSPSIPAKVLSVRFFSSASSDELFAKIVLQPLHPSELRSASTVVDVENYDENVVENDVVWFSKVLTASDANNGGGFSVPKYCADSIFPQLNLTDDPPVQNLIVTDTHGNAWEFRHIFRGTPRRHLLTTGWSRFINSKRLICGDSVVFMKRKSTGELFIGFRRVGRLSGANGGNADNGGEKAVRAIENAARGSRFEVEYYPRAGVLPDFVVRASRVESSMRIQWSPGMRVRMPVPTDDPSRITWIQGRIVDVNKTISEQWSDSPWRMLQVTWDEPGNLPNSDKVSPWEVEYDLPSSSHLFPAFSPSYKRLRFSDNGAILPDGDQGEFSFPMTEPSGSVAAAHMNPAMFHYAPFPAPVLQGVNRDVPVLQDYAQCDNSYPSFTELLQRGMETEPRNVSTAFNIGCSNAERSSNIGGDFAGRNSSMEDGARSIVLFGRIIQTGEPTEGSGGSSNNGGDGERDEDLPPDLSLGQPGTLQGFRRNCDKGKNVVC